MDTANCANQKQEVCPRCGIPMIAKNKDGQFGCLQCPGVPRITGLTVPGAIIAAQNIIEEFIALFIPGPVIVGSDEYTRVKTAITRRCRLIQF